MCTCPPRSRPGWHKTGESIVPQRQVRYDGCVGIGDREALDADSEMVAEACAEVRLVLTDWRWAYSSFWLLLSLLFLTMGCEDGPAQDTPIPLLSPQVGFWSGDGIEFEVVGDGTINIVYADYGSCRSVAIGCSLESECGECLVLLNAEPDLATFSQGQNGCQGIFDSPTSAAGTCQAYSNICRCTMERFWLARPAEGSGQD